MSQRAFLFAAIAGVAVAMFWPEPPESPPGIENTAPSSNARSASATPATSKGFSTFLDRAPDGHFYVQANVNNQPVRFMVDTGASGIALTSADAARIGIAFDPAQFQVVGTGVSGPVLGKQVMLDSVQIEGKTVNGLPAAVLGDGLDVSLLGQSFLSRYAHVGIAENRMELR
jgi:aspartyl protease family protein